MKINWDDGSNLFRKLILFYFLYKWQQLSNKKLGRRLADDQAVAWSSSSSFIPLFQSCKNTPLMSPWWFLLIFQLFFTILSLFSPFSTPVNLVPKFFQICKILVDYFIISFFEILRLTIVIPINLWVFKVAEAWFWSRYYIFALNLKHEQVFRAIRGKFLNFFHYFKICFWEIYNFVMHKS